MALKNLAKLINEASKVKPIQDQFLQDLTVTIEKADESHTPSKTYKPSSLGGCMRNLYFQVTGATPDDEDRSYTNIGQTASGTDRHVTIQTAISKMQAMGFDCEWINVAEFLKTHPVDGTIVERQSGMETKCRNTILNINFLCDGLIKYKGKYYIVEIKTESFYKWQGQVQPYDDHITQASSYSVCLGVDNIIFIYENRDSCDLKTFLVHVTDEMKEERVVGKINTCDEYVAKGEVPPKSTIKKDCTYCRYKKECNKW